MNRVKESTYANYTMKFEKHILPYFGEKLCISINSATINAFIKEKVDSGLSAGYVRDLFTVFKALLAYAQEEYSFKLSLKNVSLPKAEKKKPHKMDDEQQKKLVGFIKSHIDLTGLGVLLSLFMGLRIGELCGLKWEDVDLAGKVIHVRHTLQRIQTFSSGKKTKIVITEPKSASSVRDIPIPDCLLTLLTKHHAGDNMFVLSGKRKPVECRTLQYRFAGILNNANLPSVHFHSLRHAFATNCIALGFDVKTLSEILGHSSVEITLNRYVHSSIERKRACMSLLTWVA